MQSNFIGNKIKELRRKQDITQQKLSDDLSVASSTISNWEKGRRLPSIADLKRIASYFGVSLGYFELEVASYEESGVPSHPSTSPSQIIDTRPLGYRTKKSEWLLFLLALLLVNASVLLSDPEPLFFFLFIPGSISYGLYIFGSLLLIYALSSAQLKRIALKKNNYKRILLQSRYDVFYASASNDSGINRKSKYLKSLSLAVMLVTVLFYVAVLVVSAGFESSIMRILLALYALVAIVTSSIRHKAVKSSMVTEERVDYYRIRKDMDYSSIYLALITDTIGVLMVYAILLFLAPQVAFGLTTSLLVVLGILYLILSDRVYRDFNAVIASYQLYARDDQDNVIGLS